MSEVSTNLVTRCMVGISYTVISLAGCNLSTITDSADNLTGAVIPPETIESAEGARFVYNGAVAGFSDYFGINATSTAAFTDEISLLSTLQQTSFDARAKITGSAEEGVSDGNLTQLAQRTKVQLEQSVQLLQKYDDPASRSRQAHVLGLLSILYSMLADTFCSGFPVSTSKWGGEFVPGGAVATDSMYKLSILVADSGLKINHDSVRYKNLLLGAKARALNSLGRFQEAVSSTSMINASMSVSDFFDYRVDPADSLIGRVPRLIIDPMRYTIANNKGVNGLKWIADSDSLQDMRIPIRVNGSGVRLNPVSSEYSVSVRQIPFFSAAEAQLIEAEFYLNMGSIEQFVERINDIRSLFKTRNGIVLRDTTDPGTQDGRLSLLFKERAYTLYATGRRMGDLRRLTRLYGKDPNLVWPVGWSEGERLVEYGSNYVIIPESTENPDESKFNQKYNGCLSYAP